MKSINFDPTQPREIVKELLQYRQSGSVLDVGAGRFGNNAFYLAKHGFMVTATEHSVKNFEQLEKLNQQAGHVLELAHDSILDYQTDHQFDVVICSMLLHFLKSKSEVKLAIEKLQHWTKPGGLCVTLVYTDKNPVGTKPYLFANGELKRYFEGWRIIKLESAATATKDMTTKAVTNLYSDRMIAQKPQ